MKHSGETGNMKIVSWRAREDGTNGGVAQMLDQVLRRHPGAWYHVKGDALQIKQVWGNGESKATPLVSLAAGKADAAYGHANNELWPRLHGMTAQVLTVKGQRKAYFDANRAFARNIASDCSDQDELVVVDYQFALMPRFVYMDQPNVRCSFNLFVPWAHMRDDDQITRDMAWGMLGARQVNFICESYLLNFGQYVEQHMNSWYQVDWQSKTCVPKRPGFGPLCQLTHHPLAVDYGWWSNLARSPLPAAFHTLAGKRYVMVVARQDYTKGIWETLEALDLLLDFWWSHNQKSMVKEVSFLLVLTPTRGHLPKFKQYQLKCAQRLRQLEEKWQPRGAQILAQTDVLKPFELAPLYRDAEVVLVPSLADGYALIGPEAVAAKSAVKSRRRPGVILHSRGAGAYDVIGPWCLEVTPEQPRQMAETLRYALSEELCHEEADYRMECMQEMVVGVTLDSWVSNLIRRDERPKFGIAKPPHHLLRHAGAVAVS